MDEVYKLFPQFSVISGYNDLFPLSLDQKQFSYQFTNYGNCNETSMCKFTRISKRNADLYYPLWYYNNSVHMLQPKPTHSATLGIFFHEESIFESVPSIIALFNDIICENFLQLDYDFLEPILVIMNNGDYQFNHKYLLIIRNSILTCVETLQNKFNVLLKNDEVLENDAAKFFHHMGPLGCKKSKECNTLNECRSKKYIHVHKCCYRHQIETLRNVLVPLLRDSLVLNVGQRLKKELINILNKMNQTSNQKNQKNINCNPCCLKQCCDVYDKLNIKKTKKNNPNTKHTVKHNELKTKNDLVPIVSSTEEIINTFSSIEANDHIITTKQLLVLYDYIYDYLFKESRLHEKQHKTNANVNIKKVMNISNELADHPHSIKCIFSQMNYLFYEIVTVDEIAKHFEKVIQSERKEFASSVDFLRKQTFISDSHKNWRYKQARFHQGALNIMNIISCLYHSMKSQISKLLILYMNSYGSESTTGKRDQSNQYQKCHQITNDEQSVMELLQLKKVLTQSTKSTEINHVKCSCSSLSNIMRSRSNDMKKIIVQSKIIDEQVKSTLCRLHENYLEDFQTLQMWDHTILNTVSTRCVQHLKKFIFRDDMNHYEKYLTLRLMKGIESLLYRAEMEIKNVLYLIMNKNDVDQIIQFERNQTLISQAVISEIPNILFPFNFDCSEMCREYIEDHIEKSF